MPGRRPPTRLLLAMLVTALSLFTLVTLNVLLGQAGLVQAELETRLAQRRLEVDALQLEVARLRSPARIAERAAELGLVPAEQIVVLRGDEGQGKR